MHMLPTTDSQQPSRSGQRIEILDICRGFAVFGIFVVNIEIMNCVFLNQEAFGQQWTSAIDQLSVRILQLFFYTKFFPIFSFLFGIGIAMQALKQLEAKQLSLAFFVRRMLGLFLIGIFHIVFLWSGDVLHLYAILGLLSLLLIRRSNRLILALSIILLIFPFYDELISYLFGLIHFEPFAFLEGYSGQTITDTIRNGSYLSGMRLRILEYIANIPLLYAFLAPMAFSMFLLGLYLGKKKVIFSLDQFVDKIQKPVITLAIITNIYRLVFLFVLPQYPAYFNEATRPLFLKLMVLSDIAMGLFYLWLIARLVRMPKWNKILRPLRYAGRMALSNYLMQSLIGLILFSSIGFRLYETLSPTATLLAAAAVFVFQVLFSKLWLHYFYYGPMEWLWRCFSYQKILPIKRSLLPLPVRP